jgi:hypothetical protein
MYACTEEKRREQKRREENRREEKRREENRREETRSGLCVHACAGMSIYLCSVMYRTGSKGNFADP